MLVTCIYFNAAVWWFTETLVSLKNIYGADTEVR